MRPQSAWVAAVWLWILETKRPFPLLCFAHQHESPSDRPYGGTDAGLPLAVILRARRVLQVILDPSLQIGRSVSDALVAESNPWRGSSGAPTVLQAPGREIQIFGGFLRRQEGLHLRILACYFNPPSVYGI